MKKKREKPTEPSFDEKLKIVLSYEGQSPMNKLIVASQLWGQDEAAEPDFFEAIKPFLDGLGSKNGASEAAADQDELIALYGEYKAKSSQELLDEVKLLANGVLGKKAARALKEASEAERKRFLFVRVLIIAMEAEEEGEGEGEDEDDEEDEGAGADIDEEFIESLTEEQCAEKEQPGEDEEPVVTDLAAWVCGLPTEELQGMCDARGIELPADMGGKRLPLVQGLLRGMLEAEAGLDEDDSGEEGEEEEEEDDDDDDEEEEADSDEDDEEEEDDEESGPGPAKKSKLGSSSAPSADEKPGECKQQ